MKKSLFKGMQQSDSQISDAINNCYNAKKDSEEGRMDYLSALEIFDTYFILSRNLEALGMHCGESQDSEKIEKYYKELIKLSSQ